MPPQAHVLRQILRFLLARTGGDREVAQEVIQETCVAALRSYRTFKNKSTYFTWLTKIALNKLADYYRDQVNRRSHLVLPTVEAFNRIVDPGLSVEEKLTLKELRAQVNRCLDLLPAKYRRLLQFKYYAGLSSHDIGVKLHLSPRSLEGRLYRARRAFAKLYARFEKSPRSS